MFGSPETTSGGRALRFYASVRLDIRRIETLKEGVEAIGNRVRVKVVKNKVAPPFKQAEFDIIYGDGISWEGTVLETGLERKVVQKSGSYFSFGDERLGQGRQNATAFLKEHPDVVQEILQAIQAQAPPEQVISARLLPQAEPGDGAADRGRRHEGDGEREVGPRTGACLSAIRSSSRRGRCGTATGRAARSTQRLARAGIDDDARADALDTLERVGYVDDARFAAAARGRARRRAATATRRSATTWRGRRRRARGGRGRRSPRSSRRRSGPSSSSSGSAARRRRRRSSRARDSARTRSRRLGGELAEDGGHEV